MEGIAYPKMERIVEIQLNTHDRQALVADIVAALKAHTEQLAQQSTVATPAIPATKKLDNVLTIDGVCEYLNVTKRWVRQQITDNTIKHFRVGRQIRFKKTELEKYIQAREVLPPQPFIIPAFKGVR